MKKKKLLFLCTGNSCRSQMAEGWGRALLRDYEVFSAGVETHGMNDWALRVMAEIGIDLTSHRSKLLEEFELSSLDVIITVCDHAQESCPLLPETSRVIHHGFEDPPRLAKDVSREEDILDCYRKVRDEIKAFVTDLPELLQNTEAERS